MLTVKLHPAYALCHACAFGHRVAVNATTNCMALDMSHFPINPEYHQRGCLWIIRHPALISRASLLVETVGRVPKNRKSLDDFPPSEHRKGHLHHLCRNRRVTRKWRYVWAIQSIANVISLHTSSKVGACSSQPLEASRPRRRRRWSC